MWAEYICRFVEGYRERGVAVKRISIQNEPAAVQIWDSCVYTAKEEKAFRRDFLYPALRAHGLADLEIFIWDHNKERLLERALQTIDDDTDQMVTGIAFHWYSGDHFEALKLAHERFPDKKLLFSEGCVEYSKFTGKDQLADARMYGHDIAPSGGETPVSPSGDHFDALSMIHEKFPDKKLILSEACIEYRKFCAADHLKNARKYAHDMIGNLNHGMTGFYDWNVVLDEIGGPNHAGNFCDAPFMFHRERKELMRKNLADYLWHFTHFIKAGAVRIGVTGYSEKLEATAFLNPDGGIAVILLNTGAEEIPVNIRLGSELVKIMVEPESIASGVITICGE